MSSNKTRSLTLWYPIYQALLHKRGMLGSITETMNLLPSKKVQCANLMMALKHIKYGMMKNRFPNLTEEDIARMYYWGRKVDFQLRTGEPVDLSNSRYQVIPHTMVRDNGILTYVSPSDGKVDTDTYSFNKVEENLESLNKGKSIKRDTFFLPFLLSKGEKE